MVMSLRRRDFPLSTLLSQAVAREARILVAVVAEEIPQGILDNLAALAVQEYS